MHAHTFVTPERTPAPSQNLRGVAGACVRVEGIAAPAFALRGTRFPAPRLGGRVDAWRRAAGSGSDSYVDFENLGGGVPV